MNLPKQFSKGILIGNIAIVPKKWTGTRYVYVIADMMEAKVLHEAINLKQTAILVAHHLADDKATSDEEQAVSMDRAGPVNPNTKEILPDATLNAEPEAEKGVILLLYRFTSLE